MTVSFQSLATSAVEMHIRGKLDPSDVDRITQRTEERLEHVKHLGVLVHADTFEGWTWRGLFEGVGLSEKHCGEVSRIALVAKEEGQKWMGTAAKPFPDAEAKFFDETRIDDARNWVISTPQ